MDKNELVQKTKFSKIIKYKMFKALKYTSKLKQYK